MNHEEMEAAEPIEILNTFTEQQKIYHFEGSSGVKNLNTVCEAIGYKKHPYMYGSNLEVFLSDNPGAQQAIMEWIEKNMNEEWAESVSDELELDDDYVIKGEEENA